MDYDSYPKTRAEAVFIGAKYYFTGIPCKYGHVALRKTKGSCLECLKVEWSKSYEIRKEYFQNYNKTKGVEVKKRYYAANREKVIEKAKARAAEDKKKYRQAWKSKNPEEVRAFTNDRRRRHKDATPNWLSKEHRAEIRNIYRRAAELCKDAPKAYAVDHIVPLLGKKVCGLHVPWNLQILTAEDNYKKNNKLLDSLANP